MWRPSMTLRKKLFGQAAVGGARAATDLARMAGELAALVSRFRVERTA